MSGNLSKLSEVVCFEIYLGLMLSRQRTKWAPNISLPISKTPTFISGSFRFLLGEVGSPSEFSMFGICQIKEREDSDVIDYTINFIKNGINEVIDKGTWDEWSVYGKSLYFEKFKNTIAYSYAKTDEVTGKYINGVAFIYEDTLDTKTLVFDDIIFLDGKIKSNGNELLLFAEDIKEKHGYFYIFDEKGIKNKIPFPKDWRIYEYEMLKDGIVMVVKDNVKNNDYSKSQRRTVYMPFDKAESYQFWRSIYTSVNTLGNGIKILLDKNENEVLFRYSSGDLAFYPVKKDNLSYQNIENEIIKGIRVTKMDNKSVILSDIIDEKLWLLTIE